MRVIQQLTEHLWDIGLLSVNQVDYLVMQGFVNEALLVGYQGKSADASIEQPDPSSEALDECQKLLECDRPNRHSCRTKQLDQRAATRLVRQHVQDELVRRVIEAKEPWATKHRTDRTGKPTWEDFVPIAEDLRAMFSLELDHVVTGIWATPGSLSELWRMLDLTEFETLAGDRGLQGSAANALRVLLQVYHRRELGSYQWILRLPEMRVVANLCESYRKFLRTLQWMQERYLEVLRREVALGVEPGLFWALVLIFNASESEYTARCKQEWATYKLWARPKWETWLHAIELAKSIDSDAMTAWVERTCPGCRDIEGRAKLLMQTEIECPNGWHVPAES